MNERVQEAMSDERKRDRDKVNAISVSIMTHKSHAKRCVDRTGCYRDRHRLQDMHALHHHVQHTNYMIRWVSDRERKERGKSISRAQD